ITGNETMQSVVDDLKALGNQRFELRLRHEIETEARSCAGGYLVRAQAEPLLHNDDAHVEAPQQSFASATVVPGSHRLLWFNTAQRQTAGRVIGVIRRP